MRLFLVRHGETEENLKGICQGHLPGNLSKLGISQAKLVAKRLKDEHFDAMFSSDLKRAADTAKIISEFHSNTDLILDERLREMCFGKCEGKVTGRDFQIGDPDLGEESVHSLVVRIRDFLNEKISEFSGKTILVVGHGGSLRGFMAAMGEIAEEDIWEIKGLGNTGVSIIDFSNEGDDRIELFNDTSHLDYEPKLI